MSTETALAFLPTSASSMSLFKVMLRNLFYYLSSLYATLLSINQVPGNWLCFQDHCMYYYQLSYVCGR
ncbi:hypothetical protein BJY00DRAFT_70859 [Aspergillus carlsbadensis]|nr:hypothetical protein BJY00DRAFT_70859 [Aspergillus carlsbadensis]